MASTPLRVIPTTAVAYHSSMDGVRPLEDNEEDAIDIVNADDWEESSDESFDGVDAEVITRLEVLSQLWFEIAPILLLRGTDPRSIPLPPTVILSCKVVNKLPADCEYDVVTGCIEVSKHLPRVAELMTGLALKRLWTIS